MIPEPSIWIWLPLAIAILLAFYKQTKAAFILLAIALLGGFLEDRLQLPTMLFVVASLALAYQTPRLNKPWRHLSLGLIVLGSLALMMHWIPGFSNAKVLDGVVSGPSSAPFTMYLNLDKPLIFFLLLLAWPPLLGNASHTNKRVLSLTAILLFSLLPIAWGLGALKPELSLPSWWWLFMVNNLLFTCVAEEALFRGFLQQAISNKFGWIPGLIITSLLFGLAHFAGGPLLIAFATLAGVGYGLAFHYSSRLWVAVLFHFLFNLSHLLFFTYPILAK
ncbi:CPBP family intramembrane metalloprotease [Vibrio sp. Of7-15]|uniref:CPBP family intramembrane glutamic endopeptidase n=1 Tax=Vibrio sp. Of7-15 TaxID=2724879 RepID=UPI001EF24BA6|nr:CPBP family intramembrane glutamic endopeptidase [Vibrio sp. Of7-15]MCG7495409.1 CPBP family intramembrane metalloprotease [Vibrio sp. Of7-15]